MEYLVLIADDDPDVVDLLTRRCLALGLNVDSARDAMQALAKAEKFLPDIVILDVDMPCGNGLSVCEMMANHEELKTIPVVIMTGHSNDETVRRCHQLCAYYVPKCLDIWSRIEPLLRDILDLQGSSVDRVTAAGEDQSDTSVVRGPTQLMDAVFHVLRIAEANWTLAHSASQPAEGAGEPWVLSIEDDDDVALAIRMRLREIGLQVIRAEAGMEGYRRAFLEAPRAIILDYELPDGNGDYVMRRLKESPVTCSIPVIVLTGHREASIERQMRNLGANEFLTKPIDWKRLLAAVQGSLDQTDGSLHTEDSMAAGIG